MKNLLIIIFTFSVLFSNDVTLQTNHDASGSNIYLTSNQHIYGFQFTLITSVEGVAYDIVNQEFSNGDETIESYVVNSINGLVNDYGFTCFMDATNRLKVFSMDGNSIPPIEAQAPLMILETDFSSSLDLTIVDPIFIGMDDENNLIELEVEYGLAEYQDGWPYYTEQQVISSPAVIDIDGDGDKEVIFADYSGWVHIIDKYGEPECNYNATDQVWGSPAIADIDGDGELEIVINSKSKKMVVLNSVCDEEMVYEADQYLLGTPALGNIDDDADLEIIFGGYSSPGKIFAVNPDGTDAEGFPFELGEKVKVGVAIADVNGNGKVEIVCGTDDGNLYLIYDTAEIADGFPFVTGDDIRTAPTIYRDDDTGVFVFYTGSKDDNFYTVNVDGSLHSVIETDGNISVSNSISTIGALDYDATVFFGSESGLVFNSGVFSTNYNAFDLGTNIVSSPIVAQLSDLPNKGFITASQSQLFYEEHINNSSPFIGLSAISFNSDYIYTSSMAINDIDNDGDLEIIIGTAHGIDVIDVKNRYNRHYTYSQDNNWNMYRGNYERTGFFHSSNAVNSIDDGNIPNRFAINSIYPNPFNPKTTINYQLMENSSVRLDIYNINGQLVEQLVNINQDLGYHEVIWDASNCATGFYFVKLIANEFNETQKLILLK
ncbi:MAG: T9SS type A sorting domain-containing protein [Candidatus Marinimicrobia bacterium]|nr:T9SS type A sorting domain-containing protein [Candidatus Neomarinimicrobiota bacterium]MBL7022939.1 T9SS type A sorting domain-containing protein [Candidatus Neomarinimicrobiota bacterium]MBL7108757.1 T9SS type A sorting domain-containing protein [Candidatus Neomarinimicrobiota bacterium]